MKWILAGALMLMCGLTGAACVGAPESEETDAAEEALDSHDNGPGGSPTGPSPDCLDDCRALFEGCCQVCKERQGDRKAGIDCAHGCGQDYGNCLRDCNYRGSGGCNSLNSADCSPWAPHP